MDIFVYDKKFNVLTIIDKYESFIWTERYSENGDFELYTGMDLGLLEYIKQDNYIGIKDSSVLMIIEKINIQTDVETGNKLVITGRSVSSILERRIIWPQRIVDGNLHNALCDLINENLADPNEANRLIEEVVVAPTSNAEVRRHTLKAQYTGDNLYEVVKKVCEDVGLGFKMWLTSRELRFRLIAGVDRSYNQSENPYVVFSPSFDNIISGDYIETKSSYKNTAIIAGEGEGLERKKTIVGDEITGLDRRELYVDARDLSQGRDNERMSDESYIEVLKQRGREKLVGYPEIKSFEGQAETSIMFKYGKDFRLGDIVQVEDGYGHSTTARITEIIISEDSKGHFIRPTFKMKDTKKY